MSYVNMRDVLSKAGSEKYAVGAFNIVDAMTAEAVVRAAEAKRAPVVIQTSAKTVMLYGCPALVATVRTLAEEATVPVVLHLDHCKDLELIRCCIEAGWSSVMIDASGFPFEEKLTFSAHDYLVIEDSRNGLLAAKGAGMRCVVTVNGYTQEEDFTEADMVVTCLGDANGEKAEVLTGGKDLISEGQVSVALLRRVIGEERQKGSCEEG